MEKCRYILFTLLVTLSLIACDKDDNAIDTPARRTVLVYFAGDNSLSGYVEQNLDAIKEGIIQGGMNNCNLLVYTDDSHNAPQLSQLKLEGDTVREILIERYEMEQNSTSKETMAHVLKKTWDLFPAEGYGLVLWSHGTGWLPSDINSHLRSFGQDGSYNFMEINDLAKVLSIYHFDFIMFDACYMGCAEVAYALRNCTDYIISSPTEILANGFPYRSIVDDMFKAQADVVGIATEFYNYYKSMAGTISVVKCDELNGLATTCHDIFKDKGENDLFSIPVDDLQMMEYLKPNYHALYDFEDYISRLATKEQLASFKQQLERAVIYKAATPKAIYAYPYPNGTYLPINRFSGLSIYVPQQELPLLNNWYKCLEWYKSVY